jgi:hypothetical protein
VFAVEDRWWVLRAPGACDRQRVEQNPEGPRRALIPGAPELGALVKQKTLQRLSLNQYFKIFDAILPLGVEIGGVRLRNLFRSGASSWKPLFGGTTTVSEGRE